MVEGSFLLTDIKWNPEILFVRLHWWLQPPLIRILSETYTLSLAGYVYVSLLTSEDLQASFLFSQRNFICSASVVTSDLKHQETWLLPLQHTSLRSRLPGISRLAHMVFTVPEDRNSPPPLLFTRLFKAIPVLDVVQLCSVVVKNREIKIVLKKRYFIKRRINSVK